MILEVKNGSFSYGQREILRNISFCLEEQKIMTILGPNGVGKTTLLKCIMGFLPWNRGEARILEKNLNAYSDKELWKQISYVPQAKRSAFSYGVLEMVVMGLDRENSFFYTPKKDHFDRANEMLKELGVGKLAGRYCNELSGGELQMVMLARALVSGPKLLILDEPESNLDMKNQLRVLDAISYINQEKNTACIINTHFPAHALQLSDVAAGTKLSAEVWRHGGDHYRKQCGRIFPDACQNSGFFSGRKNLPNDRTLPDH